MIDPPPPSGPHLAQPVQIRAAFDNLIESGPILVDSGPISAASGPTSVEFGPNLVELGQNLGDSGTNSVGSAGANFGRIRGELPRAKNDFVTNEPFLARSLPIRCDLHVCRATRR